MAKLQLTRQHVALFLIFAVITACILLVLMSYFMSCNPQAVCASIVKQYESQCVCPWNNKLPFIT